MYPSLN